MAKTLRTKICLTDNYRSKRQVFPFFILGLSGGTDTYPKHLVTIITASRKDRGAHRGVACHCYSNIQNNRLIPLPSLSSFSTH